MVRVAIQRISAKKRLIIAALVLAGLYLVVSTNILSFSALGEAQTGAAMYIHADAPVTIKAGEKFEVEMVLFDQTGERITGRQYANGYGGIYIGADGIKSADGYVPQFQVDTANFKEIKDAQGNGIGVYKIPVTVDAWPVETQSDLYKIQINYIGGSVGSADGATSMAYRITDAVTVNRDTEAVPGRVRYAVTEPDKLTLTAPEPRPNDEPTPPIINVVKYRVKLIGQAPVDENTGRIITGRATEENKPNWLAPTVTDNTGAGMTATLSTITEEEAEILGEKKKTGIYDVEIRIETPVAAAGRKAVVAFGYAENGIAMPLGSTVNFTNRGQTVAAAPNFCFANPFIISTPHTPEVVFQDFPALIDDGGSPVPIVHYANGAEVVRLEADITNPDPGVNVDAAEFFIDTIGADGTGTAMSAYGGFNSTTVTAYFDIPVLTLESLAAGSHNIYIHGRQAPGAHDPPYWGLFNTTALKLYIDRQAPTAVITKPVASEVVKGNAYRVEGDVTNTPGSNGSITPIASVKVWEEGDTNWNNGQNDVSRGGANYSKWFYYDAGFPWWNTTAVPDGNYTLRAKVADAAGNVGPEATVNVVIDNMEPTMAITSPTANQGYKTGTYNITGSVNDAHFGSYTVKWGQGENPGTWTTIGSGTSPVTNGTLATWNNTGLSDGVYKIWLYAVDSGGNDSEIIRRVFVDNAVPSSAITFPTNGSPVGGTVTITGTATDATSGTTEVKVRLKRGSDNKHWNGSTWQTNEAWVMASITSGQGTPSAAWQYVWMISDITTAETVTLTSRAKDAATNTETPVNGPTVNIDLSAPEVNGYELMGLNDDGYGVTYYANGSVGARLWAQAVGTERITTAEFFYDAPGTYGNGTAMLPYGGLWNNSSLYIYYDIPALTIATMPAGTHNVYLHAQSEGEYTPTIWGGFNATPLVLYIDRTAPSTLVTKPAATEVVSGDSYRIEGNATNTVGPDGGASPIANVQVYEESQFGWQDGSNDVSRGGNNFSKWFYQSGDMWNTTQIPDGDYTLRTRAIDAAGNVGSESAVGVVVDNTPPVLNITNPTNNQGFQTGTITVTGSVTDAHFGTYTLEIGAGTNPPSWTTIGSGTSPVTNGTLGTWGITGADGSYTIRLSGEDAEGNADSISIRIFKDNVAPSSTITAPADASWARTSATITGTAADAVSGVNEVKVRLRRGDGQYWTGSTWGAETWIPATITSGQNTTSAVWQYVWAISGVAHGDTITVTTRAKDVSANTETPGAGRTIRIDLTAPPINWGSVTPNVWYTANQTISVNISDPDSGPKGFRWGWDTPPTDVPGTMHVSGGNTGTTSIPSEGSHVLYVRGYDNVDNQTYENRTYKLDTSVPAYWTTALPSTWTADTSPDVTVQARDIISGLDVAAGSAQYRFSTNGGTNWSDWTNAAVTGSAGTTVLQTLTASDVQFNQGSGTLNKIQFRIKDVAGNTGTSGSYTIMTDTGAPGSSITAFPNSPWFNGTVNWSGSDALSGVKWYDIQYKAGSGGTWTPWLTNTGLTSSVFGLGTQGTDYYFQSRAQDNAGNWEAFPNGDGDAHATLDNEPPVTTHGLAGTLGDHGEYTSDVTVTLSFVSDNLSGLKNIKYKIDSGAWQTYSIGTPFTVSGNATHTVSYYGEDNAGNLETVHPVTIIIDGAASPIPTMNPEPTFTSGDFNTVSWSTVTDPQGPVTYYVEYDDNSSFSSPDGNSGWISGTIWTFPNLVDGVTYYFHVRSKDYAGNISGWSAYVYSTQANGLPIIVWGGATPTTWYRTNQNVTAYVSEPVAGAKGFRWAWDADPGELGTVLMGNWHLNENGGATTADSSDYAQTGTLAGTSYWTASGRYGAAFNGSGDDSVTVANTANLNSSSFTVETWFYTTTANRVQGLINKWGGTNGWRLFMANTSGNIEFDAYSEVANIQTPATSINTWNHVVATYDSASQTAKIYLNGTFSQQATSVNMQNTYANALLFSPNITAPYRGRLDEVKFYGRALTQAEVTARFNEGANIFHIDGGNTGTTTFPSEGRHTLYVRGYSNVVPTKTYYDNRQYWYDPTTPGGWDHFSQTSDTTHPDASIKVSDATSGLNVDTGSAQYSYSENAGSTWTNWVNASVTGTNGTTDEQTITASAIPFSQMSTTQNKVKFRIWDVAGNGHETGEESIAYLVNNVIPEVTSVYPANLAANVETNTIVKANFSEKLLESSVNTTTFKLYNTTDDPGMTLPIQGSVTYFEKGDGTVLAFFAPWSLLDYTHNYTALITTGVEDLVGNNMAANYSWSFSTAQIQAALVLPSINQPVAGGAVNIRGTARGTSSFLKYELYYGTGANPSTWLDIGSNPRNSQVNDATLGTWDVSALSDGVYTIKLQVYDADVTVLERRVTVWVDNTKPTAAVTLPAEGGTIKGIYGTTGTGTDTLSGVSMVEVQVDGGNWVQATGHNRTEETGAAITYVGTWQTSTDAGASGGTQKSTFGTSGGANATFSFTGTAATFISTRAPNRGYAKIYIDGTAITDGTIALSGDTGENKSGIDLYSADTRYQERAYTKAGLTNGAHTIKVEQVGNMNTLSAGTRVDVDAFEIGGSTAWAYSLNTQSLSDEVPHTMRARATDRAGVVGDPCADRTFHVDNAAPTATISSPVANELAGASVTLTGTATDANFKQYDLYYGSGASPSVWNAIGTNPRLNPVGGTKLKTGTTAANATDRTNIGGSWSGNSLSADRVTGTDITLVGTVNLAAGSTLQIGTVLKTGTTAANSTDRTNIGGSWSGDTLSADWTTVADVSLAGTVNLAAGSMLKAGVLGIWNTSSLSEGGYSIKLVVTDNSLATQEHIIYPIVVDHRVPYAEITSPLNMEYSNTTFRVSGIALDYSQDGIMSDISDRSAPNTNQVKLYLTKNVDSFVPVAVDMGAVDYLAWNETTQRWDWYKDITKPSGEDWGWFGMQAKARDRAQNETASNVVYSCIDVIAPPAPMLRGVADHTKGVISLSWTPVKDTGSGVDYYEVYRGGTLMTSYLQYYDGVNINTVDATGRFYASNAVDTSISAGQTVTYSYKVRAIDYLGNVSNWSNTTQVKYDSQAPSAPSGLTASTAGSTNSIFLQWTPSTDNLSVTEYKVYRTTSPTGAPSSDANNLIGTLPVSAVYASPTYFDGNLTPGTVYRYQIVAYDEQLNMSAGSNIAQGTAGANPSYASPHGTFATDSDTCVICHRTHTARGEGLVREQTATEVCYSCHDGTASANATKQQFDYAPSGGHRVKDDKWPNGALTCVDCHSPHANPDSASFEDFENDGGVIPDGWTVGSGSWRGSGNSVATTLAQEAVTAGAKYIVKNTGLTVDSKGGKFSAKVKFDTDHGHTFFTVGSDEDSVARSGVAVDLDIDTGTMSLMDGDTVIRSETGIPLATTDWYRIRIKIGANKDVAVNLYKVIDDNTETKIAGFTATVPAGTVKGTGTYLALGTEDAVARFDNIRVNDVGMLMSRYRAFHAPGQEAVDYKVSEDKLASEEFCLACHGSAADSPGGSHRQYYSSAHNQNMGQTTTQPQTISPRWQTIRTSWKTIKQGSMGSLLKGTNNGCLYCHGYHGQQFYMQTAKGEEELCYKCHGRDSNYSRTGANVYQQYQKPYKHGLTLREATVKCTACHGQRGITDRFSWEGYPTSMIVNPFNIKQSWSEMRMGGATVDDYCNACHQDGTLPRETHSTNILVPYTIKYPAMYTTPSANGFVRTGYSAKDAGGQYIVGHKLWTQTVSCASGLNADGTGCHAIIQAQFPDINIALVPEFNNRIACTTCHHQHASNYPRMVRLPEDAKGDITLVGTVNMASGSALKTGAIFKTGTTAANATDRMNIGGSWSGSTLTADRTLAVNITLVGTVNAAISSTIKCGASGIGSVLKAGTTASSVTDRSKIGGTWSGNTLQADRTPFLVVNEGMCLHCHNGSVTE